MVVAICGTTLSTYTLLDSWNLIGNYASIMLISCAGTGMNFLLVHALFVNVSDTYMEAAEIDGAGYFTVFFRIFTRHKLLINRNIYNVFFYIFHGLHFAVLFARRILC